MNAHFLFLSLRSTLSVTIQRGKINLSLIQRPNLEGEIKIFLQSKLNGLITQRTPYIQEHTDVCPSSQGSNSTSHSTAFLLHKSLRESSVSSSEPHNPASWNPDSLHCSSPPVSCILSGKQTSYFPPKINLEIISSV